MESIGKKEGEEGERNEGGRRKGGLRKKKGDEPPKSKSWIRHCLSWNITNPEIMKIKL